VRLTGLPFLMAVCLVAAATVAATAALWQRSTRWTAAAAWPVRVTCLVAVMATGALLALTETNRIYGFYDSLSELTSAAPASEPASGDLSNGLSPKVMAAGRVAAARGRGLVVHVTLAGDQSRIRRPAFVYLPARYFDGPPDTRFPVIELFHGYPGIARNWISQLGLAGVLNREIGAGRVPPMIAVVPTDTDGQRDEECVDAVGGAADDTYLSSDIPAAVVHNYRALTSPRAWATMGYSTGGYCAVNLALRHPDRYSAAVSMSGYFDAEGGRAGRALFRGSDYLSTMNSPSSLVRDRADGVALYLAASGGDRDAMTALTAFRRDLPISGDATVVDLPAGGHNYRVWGALEPAAIDWIGAHLTGPSTTPLRSPGTVISGPAASTAGPGERAATASARRSTTPPLPRRVATARAPRFIT
jgi:S-formylglutathione hydrolase FrmB